MSYRSISSRCMNGALQWRRPSFRSHHRVYAKVLLHTDTGKKNQAMQLKKLAASSSVRLPPAGSTGRNHIRKLPPLMPLLSWRQETTRMAPSTNNLDAAAVILDAARAMFAMVLSTTSGGHRKRRRLSTQRRRRSRLRGLLARHQKRRRRLSPWHRKRLRSWRWQPPQWNRTRWWLPARHRKRSWVCWRQTPPWYRTKWLFTRDSGSSDDSRHSDVNDCDCGETMPVVNSSSFSLPPARSFGMILSRSRTRAYWSLWYGSSCSDEIGLNLNG